MGLWVFLVFSCFFLGGSGGSFEGFQWVCGFFWCFLVFFWEVLVVLLRVFNGFVGFSNGCLIVVVVFSGVFWWLETLGVL